MANFVFNVSPNDGFSVVKTNEITTECATIFEFKINASNGDTIRMELGQTFFNFANLVYIINGVETSWDGSSIDIVYGADLNIRYSIGNSGTPGLFHQVRFEVINVTKSQTHSERTIRENDSLECDNPTGNGGTYDDLTDTPNSKVGNALKLVRVNASETDHEYVDPGTLGNDLNYTHVQSSSALWTIPHNLGKIPSVTVIDGSGNRVHGDVNYVDLNNLTITFNTAFAGTAYLN